MKIFLVGIIQGFSLWLLIIFGGMNEFDSIPTWEKALCLGAGVAFHDFGMRLRGRDDHQ